MESGKIFGFIWGGEFAQYGVSILNASLQSEVSECRKVDVTNASNWSGLVGATIANVEVVWQWVKEAGLFKKKIYYPQSVVIIFSSGKRVVVSAMEIREKSYWGMADNITVFFDANVASQFGALNA